MIRSTTRTLLTLWALATVSFFAVRLAPGDPALVRDAGVPATHADVQRRLYGLDRPIASQYRAWLSGLATGRLGWSYDYRRPVADVLSRTAGPTLLLTVLALLVQCIAGVAGAAWATGAPGRAARLDAVLAPLHAAPTFWLALGALTLSAQVGSPFPRYGARSLDVPLQAGAGALDLLHHAALPALVLGLGGAAAIYRLTLGGALTALRSDAAVAARARGLTERQVRWRIGLGSALGPAIQRLGLDLPMLLGGALVVEVVFSRPGLGRTVHRAFLARDLPLLAAGSFAAGTLVVLGGLAADHLARRLDPRIGDE